MYFSKLFSCSGGLIDCSKNFYPEEPEEYFDFATAESAFYPQLRDWYDESNNEWLEDKLELKRQKEQDKKRIKKSRTVPRAGTQEGANRLNAGGSTQIVLNRRGNKPIKKSRPKAKLMTQEDCDRLNAGGATQIVLKRREPKYEVSRKNLKGRSKN